MASPTVFVAGSRQICLSLPRPRTASTRWSRKGFQILAGERQGQGEAESLERVIGALHLEGLQRRIAR